MTDYEVLRGAATNELKASNVAEIISARQELNQKSLSFEFFPPRDASGEQTLWKSFDALVSAGADFVSLTYGAGGSNRERSLATVEVMAPQVRTVAHLTCVGATKTHTVELLHRFQDAGVSSILAIRGDSPKDDPEALQKGELKSALDLVELVKQNTDLEVGVGAFPEGHPESENLAQDARVLALKQHAGATYAITQLFFTVEAYQQMIAQNVLAGATIPVIPGLMPINNAAQVLRMAQMSNAKVPDELFRKLSDSDEATARRIGMDYTIELGARLLELGAPGLQIFTLNQQTAALELARGVGLVR